ncbi:MAG TPA: dCTP deaminase [Patescibacteria group bacterium]|jgi:dCTP deaminase
MILSDRDIKKQIAAGRIKIEPAADYAEALGSCSIDLRLSSKFRVFKQASTPYIDPRDPNTFDGITEPTDIAAAAEEQPLLPHLPKGPRAFVLHPGEFALGLTHEYVELPDDICARIEGKSSLGRLGIVIHSTAGHIDAGYKGNITLEITNIGMIPVLLYPTMRFCQLSFEQLTTPAEIPYFKKKTNKYAGTTAPGASKIFEETAKSAKQKKAVKEKLKRLSPAKPPKKITVR